MLSDHYRIDVPTVWNTVANDLGPLKEALLKLLGSLPPAP
jgi:uncharacterized protein with HEPN domain